MPAHVEDTPSGTGGPTRVMPEGATDCLNWMKLRVTDLEDEIWGGERIS